MPQETLAFLQEPCDHSSDFSSHELTGMNEQEMSQCNLVITTETNHDDTDSSSESENSGPEIWDIEPDVECEPSNLEKEIIIVIIQIASERKSQSI